MVGLILTLDREFKGVKYIIMNGALLISNILFSIRQWILEFFYNTIIIGVILNAVFRLEDTEPLFSGLRNILIFNRIRKNNTN